MSWLDFLNDNNGIITALATVILVFITFWYARMTNKMVKALNHPEILINLQPEERNPCHINLCIQNIGTGAASDLKFEGDLSFRPAMPKLEPISERGILKNGIDYLGPGKKLEIFLFYSQHMFQYVYETNKPISEHSIDITVKYKDSTNRKKEKSFLLTFDKWEGYGDFESDPISQIGRTLEERIAETLENIESTLKDKHTNT